MVEYRYQKSGKHEARDYQTQPVLKKHESPPKKGQVIKKIMGYISVRKQLK